MTHSLPRDDITIDSINSQALSKAIGERLQDSLGKSTAMPPHLGSLLKQMRLSDVPLATR